jgi:hypothetical protein
MVPTEFARDLERERDSERALADRLAEGLRVYSSDEKTNEKWMANFYLAAWKEARND